MEKKASKMEAALIGAFSLIGLPLWLVSKFVESVGWIVPALAVAAVACLGWYVLERKRRRLAAAAAPETMTG